MEDDAYEKKNELPEYDYDFTMLLEAITQDFIYVSNRNGGYYKIPKSLDDCLYDVGINDNVGIVTFKDGQKTFLAFEDFCLYYDISTPDLLEKLNITITDSL